ncbi:MAG: segregation/condensation protein A [Clostridia bacterium]|nr:segregation/condensation protein A [Clostridia bacterium]
MRLEIKIDAFEGPLDLLLHLITKEEIDIYDIPIVNITDQYLKTIEFLPEMDLDLTTEFLVMAATLLEIKSRMLLPDQNGSFDVFDIEGDDPRRELVKRLIEYKKFKDAAGVLRDKESALDEIIFKDQEELNDYTRSLSPEELNQGLEADLLTEAVKRLIQKIERFDHHRKTFFKGIKRDLFTVEEKIDYVQSKLSMDRAISFSELFERVKTREEVVVTFLAILELLKMKRIAIRQDHLFDEIYIEHKKEVTEEEL